MAYCQNCGMEIPENAKFCGNCGNKVETPSKPPVVETVVEEKPVEQVVVKEEVSEKTT